MFERAVESAVEVPLNQNQFDALVSFTFNVGAGNFQKSTLLRKLNARDYQGAADQFPAWNKAAGKVMAGLTRRRAEERALFLKPTTSDPRLNSPTEPGSSGPTATPAPSTRNDGKYETPPGFWSRFWTALTKRLSA